MTGRLVRELARGLFLGFWLSCWCVALPASAHGVHSLALASADLLHDESAALTIEQVARPGDDASFTDAGLPATYVGDALWLRWEAGELAIHDHTVLEAGQWWIDSADAYLVDPGGGVTALAAVARDGYFSPQAFPLAAGQAAGARLYLRLAAEAAIPRALRLWEADAYAAHQERERLAAVAALGALGTCLGLLLILAAVLREPSPAWLALAVLGTGCYVALQAGAAPVSWLESLRGHLASLNPVYTLPIAIGALGVLRSAFPLAALLPRTAAAVRFGVYALLCLWLTGPALSLQLGLGRWFLQFANGVIVLVAGVYFGVLFALFRCGHRSALTGVAMLLPLGAAGLASIPWVGRALPPGLQDSLAGLLPLLTTLLGLALLGSRLWETVRERRRLRESHRLRDLEVKKELERAVRRRTLQAEKSRLRAEKLARVKERFMAAVSHDLRTPLTTVVGLAEMAELDSSSLCGVEQQRMLRQASRYMLDIIEDLTLFERLERGAERAVANRFALADLAQDVEELLQERARDAQVALVVRTEAGAREVVSDRRYLARVLVNLVSNGLAATPSGGRVVAALALETGGATKPRLRLVVEDNGRGLEPEALAALRRGEAAGHGFTVVTELVHALQGELAISSTPGSGTRVTVTLPVDAGGEEQPEAREARAAAPEQRILFVEDVIENQLIGRALLSALGHTVTTAKTLAECRRALGQAQFDSVLLDRQLPDGDGLASLKVLRSLCRDAGYYPRFVLVTADASAEARDEAQQEGFDALLTKPYSTIQLMDALGGGSGRLPEVAAEGHRNYLELLPPELQGEVLQGFQATAEAVDEALAEASRHGDVQRALSASHRLVGSASMASFSQLADAARRFNEELKQAETINQEAVQQLREQLQAARGRLLRDAPGV